VQTSITAVPCALLCSQPGGRKTLQAGLEYRSESSLPKKGAEHHSLSFVMSIITFDSHSTIASSGHTSTKESHISHMTVQRTFHFQASKSWDSGDSGRGGVGNSFSTSSHPFFSHSLAFCMRQL